MNATITTDESRAARNCNTTELNQAVDRTPIQAALESAGWIPSKGQTLADGLAWLAESLNDARGEVQLLERETDRLRDRLDERADKIDELQKKYRKESRARLKLAGEHSSLKCDRDDLERKLHLGWEAERDRLRSMISDLEGRVKYYEHSLQEIEDSHHPEGRLEKYSAARHQWCVNRAERARKALMPCENCLLSHTCMNAYDEGNRGRVAGYDCLYLPEGW